MLPNEPSTFDGTSARSPGPCKEFGAFRERQLFVDNLPVRIHFVIVVIGWTGLAPWEFEFPSQGSLTSAFCTR